MEDTHGMDGQNVGTDVASRDLGVDGCKEGVVGKSVDQINIMNGLESAAIQPQQQWTPSTKAICFKGHTLDSDDIGKSASAEVMISTRIRLHVSNSMT